MWLVYAGDIVNADDGIGNQTFTFDIPSQSADSALTEFAEQADLTLVFPDDLVRDRTANALVGEYSLEDGAAILLEGTGLTPSFSNPIVLNITIDDMSSGGEKAMNATKKAGLVAIIAGAFSGGADAQESTVTETEIQTSVVIGRVTDARTGANLKGAKVTIEETGRWASTGDLGRFRLTNVPQGSVTLTVSNLGYAGQSAVVSVGDGGVTQNFALRGGSEIEEIVVFGQRSARALAVNRERTAENSTTVVSSDLLGNFTGTTISEALRRLPGVAFQQDFDTGDGTNIVVRGLAPDLNVVRFNGIELAEGSGEGRSANLNNLLADSVDSISISTTLLPNQDSGGTGGLVEIETKSALDRPARFAQLGVEVRDRDEGFLDDTVYTGTLSGRLGPRENFGVSLSLQFRDREIRSVSGGATGLLFGAYLPPDSEGNNTFRDADQVPPGIDFPFFSTPGADDVYPTSLNSADTRTQSETYSLGINLAYDWADHSTLRFDYQRLKDDRQRLVSGIDLFSAAPYRERPVVARGGEVLRALDGSFGFAPSVVRRMNYSDNTSTTDVFSFRGETNWNQFTFDYLLGYTNAENDSPNTRRFTVQSSSSALGWDDATFISPQAVNEVEGQILSVFAPLVPGDESIPIPLYTKAGFAALNNPEGYQRISASRNSGFGENDRRVAEFSGRYDFSHDYLRYVEVGFDYEKSEARSFSFTGGTVRAGENYENFSDIGIGFNDVWLGGVGQDIGVLTISPSDAQALLLGLENLAANGLLVVPELEAEDAGFDVRATETEFAPYFQARIDIGDVEIIGGGRYSIIDIDANDFDSVRLTTAAGFDQDFFDQNASFRTESVTQEKFLPRLIANYRPNENIVVRVGYSTAIARPQLTNLSDGRSFSLNTSLLERFNFPARLTVRTGNPDLQPAETDSYDLSFEYYGESSGAFKLGIFYKSIENLTEQNVTEGSDVLDGVLLPDFESAELFPSGFNPDDYPNGFSIAAAIEAGDLIVTNDVPVNNPDDATIWGFTASAETQFDWLPGIWSGFGGYANYTYTNSEKNQPLQFNDAGEIINVTLEGVPFNGDPEHSGTVALIYNDYSIDSALIYTAQERSLNQFVTNGLGRFTEPFETLDFRFAYNLSRWGGDYQIVFEASDILRDTQDPTLLQSEGDDRVYYTNRSYLGGREFRVGLTATF